MTDSTYDAGAENSGDRRQANGHTITGDPHRDGPIPWEQVEQEVDEE